MKKLFKHAIIFAALTVAFATPRAARAQSDPRIGTWALNVAKSKYSPGPPPTKETRTYTKKGDTLSVSVESVDQQGHQVTLKYAAVENGKDYPLTGLPGGNAIAMTRVNDHTFEADTKKDGKVIGTTQGEISKDGRAMILIFRSVSSSGQPVTNVALYEKK